jgi:hypothetical protein
MLRVQKVAFVISGSRRIKAKTRCVGSKFVLRQ